MRYVSAERTIAAAGAAFACAEDDVSFERENPAGRMGGLRRFLWRALLITGLVVA